MTPIGCYEKHTENDSAGYGYIAAQESAATSDALYLLVSSLNTMFPTDNAIYYIVYLSKNNKTSQCTFLPKDKSYTILDFHVASIELFPARSACKNDRVNWKVFWPKNSVKLESRENLSQHRFR